MPSRSSVRPALAAAVVGLAATLSGVADASPPVPPVAEIPVAPIPLAKKKAAPPEARPPATVVTTTTTTTVPSLAAVAVEPAAPAPRTGSTELMPALPAAPVVPHVVLVDELPFKASHTRARELPEHAHHGKQGQGPSRGARSTRLPGIVVDVSDATGGATAEDLQRDARQRGLLAVSPLLRGKGCAATSTSAAR